MRTYTDRKHLRPFETPPRLNTHKVPKRDYALQRHNRLHVDATVAVIMPNTTIPASNRL